MDNKWNVTGVLHPIVLLEDALYGASSLSDALRKTYDKVKPPRRRRSFAVLVLEAGTQLHGETGNHARLFTPYAGGFARDLHKAFDDSLVSDCTQYKCFKRIHSSVVTLPAELDKLFNLLKSHFSSFLVVDLALQQAKLHVGPEIESAVPEIQGRPTYKIADVVFPLLREEEKKIGKAKSWKVYGSFRQDPSSYLFHFAGHVEALVEHVLIGVKLESGSSKILVVDLKGKRLIKVINSYPGAAKSKNHEAITLMSQFAKSGRADLPYTLMKVEAAAQEEQAAAKAH